MIQELLFTSLVDWKSDEAEPGAADTGDLRLLT